MPLITRMPDPTRTASALSPVIFSLGDPDLLFDLLSSNPAGVVLVEARPALTVAFANETFRRWAPLGGQAIVGASLPDLFSWADRASVRAAYGEAIRTGRPRHRRSVPYHLETAGGTRIGLWNASHYPLRGPTGRVTHVLSFVTEEVDHAAPAGGAGEVHERMLSALADIVPYLASDADLEVFFAELTATIARLVGASRVVFWRHDEDAQTVAPQRATFGLGDDEVAALDGLPCRPDGDHAMERVVFDDATLRGDADAGEVRLGADRSLVQPLRSRDVVAIPWTAGEHRLGALTVYGSTRPGGFQEEDVWVLRAAATAAALVWEHRRADEALAAMREREAANLRQQIEQSMQLEQLKADFLRLASHELRGPLAIVRGYLSMMEDGTLGTLGEHVAEVLPLLRAKLEEMNQLI